MKGINRTQREIFLKNIAQTSDSPLGLEIQRAENIYLIDKNNKYYIDLISGIAVSNLGHNHPQIIKAIKDQADRYMHTLVYGEFILSPQTMLANMLTALLPENLSTCYFVNSGAEATEGAMKLAKRYTQRTKIIACNKSYHGSTQGAMSLMSESFFTGKFRPLLPAIEFINFNKLEDLHKIDEETACVIIEPIKAEVGVQLPESGYLEQLRAQCTKVGALLVFDEIQVGCGRTGKLFAFEHFNVVPDVLLLSKSFGGGMPLGVFVASKEIMQTLSFEPFLGHITTFGGHPVSCAAAYAALKILKEEDIVDNVEEKACLFKSILSENKSILEIRNKGLIMALQMDGFSRVKEVINMCLNEGLITDWFLFNDAAIRIAPPLIINQDQIEKACDILNWSIKKTDK